MHVHCLHRHMYALRRTYIQTHMHTCIHTHTYIHIYMYIRAHTHTCMRAYIHPSIHPFIHTYICTYVHTYIRTYVHACMHTHTQTQTHTHTHTQQQAFAAYLKFNKATPGSETPASCNILRYLLTAASFREEGSGCRGLEFRVKPGVRLSESVSEVDLGCFSVAAALYPQGSMYPNSRYIGLNVVPI